MMDKSIYEARWLLVPIFALSVSVGFVGVFLG
jgi:hypothetical protein